MNPNSQNPTNLQGSNWYVIPAALLDQLLAHAHAIHQGDRAKWSDDVRQLLNEASKHGFHEGNYILVSEEAAARCEYDSLVLHDSLDWIVHEKLSSLSANKIPAHWDPEWRMRVCREIHQTLLKQQRRAVVKATTELWRRSWLRIKKAYNLKGEEPDTFLP